MGAVALGALFALVVIAAARPISTTRAHALCAVLLGGAAGVYVGGSFARGDAAVIAIECAGCVGYVIGAVRGVASIRVLGWAWLLHAGWDLMHYNGVVATSIPGGYPVACAVADILIGGYLLDCARRGAQHR